MPYNIRGNADVKEALTAQRTIPSIGNHAPLWVTGTDYIVGDWIRNADDRVYRCTVAHTAAALFSSDVNANWQRTSDVRVFDVYDFGATGDGTTDDQPALAACMAAADAANGVMFIPEGVFVLDAPLTILGGVTIMGVGEGSQLKVADGNTSARINHAGQSPCHIYNIAFNLNVAGSPGYNSTAMGITHGVIDNCRVFDGAFATGFFVGTGSQTHVAVLRNSRAENCGTDGIAAGASAGRTLVTGNSVVNCGTKGVDIEPANSGTVICTNNTFINSGSLASIYVNNDHDNQVIVANNHVLDGTGDGIYVRPYSAGTSIEDTATLIMGNTVKNPDDHGIRVQILGSEFGGNCVVSNNIILNPGQSGAVFDGLHLDVQVSSTCKGVTFKDNYIYDRQAVPTMRYGVYAAAANLTVTMEEINVTGNMIVGAVTAPVFFDNSGGTWWPQATTDLDTTPSVAGQIVMRVENSAATTITSLDDGVFGQNLLLKFTNGNTTIDFSTGNLKGNQGANWLTANGDVMKCFYDGTDWWCTPFNSEGQQLGAVATFSPGADLTIAAGSITGITHNFHKIDTEGGAANDDLDTIVAPAWLPDGFILILAAFDDANTVTVTENGNINQPGGGATTVLNTLLDRIMLQYDSATDEWNEVSATNVT